MTDTDKGMSTGSGCLLLLFLVPLLGFVLDFLYVPGLLSFVWKALLILAAIVTHAFVAAG
jgi:hypothetical protein